MTYEQQRTTVERDISEPVSSDGRRVATDQVAEQRVRTAYRPSGSTLASRVVVVIFGIVQALIILRILLLALDAQRSNDIVGAILGASKVFVAPFQGMFATDALSAGGSVLDIAAVTALIAITIVELVVLAILRIPRRNEAI